MGCSKLCDCKTDREMLVEVYGLYQEVVKMAEDLGNGKKD